MKCPNCKGRGHWLAFYSRPLWLPCTICHATTASADAITVRIEEPSQMDPSTPTGP